MKDTETFDEKNKQSKDMSDKKENRLIQNPLMIEEIKR
jgi:hypothetical protein